jgi:Leucine Rich repeat
LEIDISGKQLTDDEFHEFVLDLRCALEYKNSDYPHGVNKLQELHLQGNSLTSDSLVELAKVIFLSSKDLKELDLSNNKINIITSTDVQKWQYFLHSFNQCCVLKKVDFSNNVLGSRGVEVLARVYIRSELDFVETEPDKDTDEDAVTNAGVPVPTAASISSSSQAMKSSQRRGKHFQKRLVKHNLTNSPSGSQVATSASKVYTKAELRRFACTRGLRSVPYLILQNVAMTNGGIIHLAEMLKLHRTPEHLLSFLPYGKPPSLPNSENALRGIHWLPNDRLGRLSVKLMKLTSQLQSSAESDSEDELPEEFQNLALNEDLYGLERRQQRQKLNVELNRVIKLQRIDVLGSEGMMKSEIWHCALRMLATSRAILLDPKDRPPSAEEELQASSSKKSRSSESADSREKSIPASRPLPIPEIVRNNTNQWSTPPGVLISSFRFDPESSTFDLMFPAMHSPPANPLLRNDPPPVAAAMSAYPSPTMQSPQLHNVTTTEGHSTHSRAKGAGDATTTRAPRDKLRFGLPLYLWGRIIGEALSVKRILHWDQQIKILSYALSWDALAAEVSINGAPEHQQLWKILDSIDCFTYKPLS